MKCGNADLECPGCSNETLDEEGAQREPDAAAQRRAHPTKLDRFGPRWKIASKALEALEALDSVGGGGVASRHYPETGTGTGRYRP
jgi:hypothetical protein